MMPISKAWISGTWTSRGFHVICISPDCAVAGQSKITWQAMKIVGRGLGVQSCSIKLDPSWSRIPFLGRLLLYLYDTLWTSFSLCFETIWASRCDEKSVCFFGSGSMAGTQANEWYSHKQPEWKIQPTRRLVVFFLGGGGARQQTRWAGQWIMRNDQLRNQWLIDCLIYSIFMYIFTIAYN